MPHRCKRFKLCTLLLALTPLFGCGGEKAKNGPGGKESQLPTREVRLAKATEERIAKTVDLTGTLAADEEAELATKVAGRIESISVDIGSRVAAGQVIARLIPNDFQIRVNQAAAALAQARVRIGLPAEGPSQEVAPEATAGVKQAAASLKQAQLSHDRAQRLFNDQLLARSDLDVSEAALSVAEGRYQDAIEEARNRFAVVEQRRSELDLARQQLSDSTVVAPFAGAIRERLVARGDYAAAGTAVAVLVRVHPLRLRLAVPERDSGAVRVGQTVQVTLEGDAQQRSGRVVRVAPALREDDRTLAVEAEIPNPSGELRPGAFVRARIVIDAADPAVLVPTNTIVTFAGIEKVIGVESGKAVEKRVRTGRRSGEQVEIVEGVKAGDAVVVDPGNLVSGQPVKVLS
jgi:RND family efflux transporter MFP subunit